MNPPTPPPASHADIMASLFATMVMQQAQMALMLLGQMPHPETGETITDLEGAQMFIDQLEMLAMKTKGNLSKVEEQLLQQSLVGTRKAFVDALRQHQGGQPTPAAPAPVADKSTLAPVREVATPAPAEDESRKKFSKKY